MENIIIRKAQKEDIDVLFDLINGLALYEKRPQDMTGSKEQLIYWLFEKNIATALLCELDGKAIGYAIYYPIFGSFPACGKVHLEDIFINEEFRGRGIGKYFLAKVIEYVFNDGYAGMEWSCLDWNTPSINFYKKLGAKQETGREYFEFDKTDMEKLLQSIK